MLTKIMKSKALTFGLIALIGVTSIGIVTPNAFAADDISRTCTQWQIDQGLCQAGLRDMLLKIINWFMLFLGLIATAFLIYGGFLYVTSAGNDQNIEKAKKLIIYAAIGIVVILLSAVLVNALVNMLSSGAPDNA